MDNVLMMLPAPLQQISTHLDFPGQRLAERIFQVILVVAGVIGFGVGYATQQLSHAVYIVLGGAVLSSLIVLPPWPFFRRQPLPWQPVGEASKDTVTPSTEGEKAEKTEKKDKKKEKETKKAK